MGSSMTCKHQHCCGDMRHCTGPHKPANRILAALLSEHGRVTCDHRKDSQGHCVFDCEASLLDEGARDHVEATDHSELHDLHRHDDDGGPGCPDERRAAQEEVRRLQAIEETRVIPLTGDPEFDAAIYLDLRRQGYTEKEATEMLAEAVPAVIQKLDRGLHLPTDAKARKAVPLCTGVLDYFPKALAAVAEVSRIGNDQHNPGQPLHWAKGKSTDHADCAIRHFAERGVIDTDGGRHTAKAAWRVLAHLEMEIEAEEAGMSYADYIAWLKAQEAA